MTLIRLESVQYDEQGRMLEQGQPVSREEQEAVEAALKEALAPGARRERIPMRTREELLEWLRSL